MNAAAPAPKLDTRSLVEMLMGVPADRLLPDSRWQRRFRVQVLGEERVLAAADPRELAKQLQASQLLVWQDVLRGEARGLRESAAVEQLLKTARRVAEAIPPASRQSGHALSGLFAVEALLEIMLKVLPPDTRLRGLNLPQSWVGAELAVRLTAMRSQRDIEQWVRAICLRIRRVADRVGLTLPQREARATALGSLLAQRIVQRHLTRRVDAAMALPMELYRQTQRHVRSLLEQEALALNFYRERLGPQASPLSRRLHGWLLTQHWPLVRDELTRPGQDGRWESLVERAEFYRTDGRALSESECDLPAIAYWADRLAYRPQSITAAGRVQLRRLYRRIEVSEGSSLGAVRTRFEHYSADLAARQGVHLGQGGLFDAPIVWLTLSLEGVGAGVGAVGASALAS